MKKFTLVELLVVIAIIAILASFLIPSLSRARYQGRAVVCMTNQQQLYKGHYMHATDNKGLMPQMTSMARNPWDYPTAAYTSLKSMNFQDNQFDCSFGDSRLDARSGSKSYIGYSYWVDSASSGEMNSWAYKTPDSKYKITSQHNFFSDTIHSNSGGRDIILKGGGNPVKDTVHRFRSTFNEYNAVFGDGHGEVKKWKTTTEHLSNGWGEHWYAKKQPNQ